MIIQGKADYNEFTGIKIIAMLGGTKAS